MFRKICSCAFVVRSVAHKPTKKMAFDRVFGPGGKDKASQHNIFLCDLVTVD